MAGEYRVSTFATEILHDGPALGPARVSTFAAEILHSGSSAARVTTVALEVLTTYPAITADDGCPTSIIW